MEFELKVYREHLLLQTASRYDFFEITRSDGLLHSVSSSAQPIENQRQFEWF
jgi:hypothetical protein